MHDKNDLSLLRSFLDSDRKAIALAIAASMASGACSALLIAFVGKQFTSVSNFGFTSMAYFFGLLIVSLLTSLYASHVLIDVSSQYSYSLKLTLCRRILGTHYARLETIGGHRLTAMLAEDMASVSMAFSRIPEIAINVARVFFCVAYLLWLAPWTVSILILLSIPVVYVQLMLFRYSRRQMRLLLPIRDQRYRLYASMVAGFKELLVHRFWRYRFYHNYLEPNADEFKQSQRKMLMASQYAMQWGQSAYFFVVFGLLVVSSQGHVEAEVVAAFALVGLFVRGALNSLLQVIPVWFRAKTAVEKINSLALGGDKQLKLSREDSHEELAPEKIHKKELTLQLSQIQFFYPDNEAGGTPALGPIDLTLRSGELVFITGGNGSGKTTLVKMLVALYKLESGQIQLNNQAVTRENTDWYQQHFYPLFSDFNLTDEFLQTVYSLGGKSKLSALSSMLPAGAAVTDSSDSSDATGCSQSSSAKLSSGEKARLALHPMMFLDRPIVIFDEWAAHQDPAFKQMFYHELLPELKSAGTLVIVVTHDDRYFGLADKLIKLDAGRIVEEASALEPVGRN